MFSFNALVDVRGGRERRRSGIHHSSRIKIDQPSFVANLLTGQFVLAFSYKSLNLAHVERPLSSLYSLPSSTQEVWGKAGKKKKQKKEQPLMDAH
jgi:hypothetical protein